MGHGKKRKRNENKPTEDESNEETTKAQTSKATDEESTINRRARIIVRNLSFKTTDATLKEHFEKYGPVSEVNILKRPDGKLVGCGFIQFKVVQNAAKAIFNATGKPFLGRDIVCDWAMGKKTYVQNMQAALKKEIKVENDEPIEVKDEVASTSQIKSEDSDEVFSEKDSSPEDESDEEESDEVEDEEYDDEKERKRKEETITPRVSDIHEGKTVFIKNVPFGATNDDVGYCLSQFGPLYYARICVDKTTDYSRGTAFVKFMHLEDVEKCLQAGTELTLFGNVLDCYKAHSKTDMDSKQSQKKVDKKDSRNLYLVKEGVILAGTKAAEGVSASDMAKRLELERWKTQMLRNLNMFISNNRLVIHNLPPTFDDGKLRQLVTKFAGPNAVIRETRVMRDLRNLDDKGVGASKEFGFISLGDHEATLRLLRSLNNNPNIFSTAKRPILAFSIENKTVINAKAKRMERSKMNNPSYKHYSPNTGETQSNNNERNKFGKTDFKNKKGAGPSEKKYFGKLSFKNKKPEIDTTEKTFTGVNAKPGISKMRSKFKLRTQAQLHHENLKAQKKKQKSAKKTLEQRKQDFIRQPGQKQNNKTKGDDNFSKLVNKYKTNLTSNINTKKNKWYDT